jgi:hypothetical protein
MSARPSAPKCGCWPRWIAAGCGTMLIAQHSRTGLCGCQFGIFRLGASGCGPCGDALLIVLKSGPVGYQANARVPVRPVAHRISAAEKRSPSKYAPRPIWLAMVSSSVSKPPRGLRQPAQSGRHNRPANAERVRVAHPRAPVPVRVRESDRQDE